MAFTVVIGRRAQADIANTVESPGWATPAAAERWRSGVFTRVVTNLEADPERYPQAYEAAALGFDLREMLYGKRKQVYRFLFTIEGQTVRVLRVRHAAQDWLTDADL